MRFKAIKLITAALATASLVIGPIASAHAARGMEVAIQDDSVFLNQAWYGRDERVRQGPGARRHPPARERALVARDGPPHGQQAPADPGYNWAPFDSLIDQAAAHGIRVQLTLTGPAPAWATSNHRIGVVKPQRQAVRQVRRRRRRALQGQGRPLRHLERAELVELARAPQELADDLPRPLHGRLQRDQARRLEGEGADRRDLAAGPRPRRPGAAPVAAPDGRPLAPEGRRLRAPPVRLPPRAEQGHRRQGRRHARHAQPADQAS